MAAEIEVPVEHVQEHIHHEAAHSKVSWISQVALSSAIFAVLAAVAALFAAHHSNEAVIDQINASQQWNYYQSKGIKSDILAAKLDLLARLDKAFPDQHEVPAAADGEAEQGAKAEGKVKGEGKDKEASKDQERVTKLREDKEKSMEAAKKLEERSEHHLATDQVLSRSVTFFQITIAIGAIAVLTKRRRFWVGSLALGLVGIAFFVQGFMLAFK